MSSQRKDEFITLEHGSGGILSRELVESVIYPKLKSKMYPALNDATPFSLDGKGLMTTDTYTVNPPFFPGGDIGKLAVYGSGNDIAVSGGRPRMFSMGMVIEEGFPLPDLEGILESISSALEETDTAVITGDTKVVPRGKGGQIYINTSCIGELIAHPPLDPGRIVPGDKIIVSGPVGSHGAAVLAARERMSAGSSLVSDAASLFPLCEALFPLKEKIRFIRDATRGGVAAVMNEIISGRAVGIHADEERFPVLDEVASFTQILGLNPLEIANEGVLIAVIAGDAAEDAVEKLHRFPLGSHAALVGEITEQNPGKVVLTTRIGGRRFLGYPRGLLLPRIC